MGPHGAGSLSNGMPDLVEQEQPPRALPQLGNNSFQERLGHMSFLNDSHV
jgi:hypothetical protein